MQIFKKFLGLVMVASLLVVTGCEKPAPTTESPDMVLLKMQEQHQIKKSESKKNQVDGSFTFKIKAPETDISASGDVDVATDATDINNTKVDIALSLEGKGSGGGMKGDAKIAANVRLLGQTLYLKLGELELNSSEDPAVAQQVQMMSAFIAGKWFMIPLPEDQKLSPISMGGPFSSGNSQFTEEQIEQIEELAKTIPFAKFLEDLGSGNGKYHYKVTLHEENIIEFIKRITKIMEVELTGEDLNEITEIFQAIETEAEFIIDAKTYELNEIKNGKMSMKPIEGEEGVLATINVKLSDEKAKIDIAMTIDDNGETAKVDIALDFNLNPNANVNIEAPEDAQEFDPLMMMGLSGGMVAE